MAQQLATYSAVAFPGVNAVAKLKADENNYYKCILGAFNTHNHSGVYYPLLPSVEALFGIGGIVRRRLDAGLCRGEYGHPKLTGMSLECALQRLSQIDPLLTSHHIKSITLQPHQDEYGKDIVLAIGMVSPTGPYGDCLERQLKNPEENVAFSIRSFTNNTIMAGRPAKIVTDALTYDFVTEPGISNATQFKTASLEELIETFTFTNTNLTKAIDTVAVSGLESEYSTLVMVRTSLGWQRVQSVNLTAVNWQ